MSAAQFKDEGNKHLQAKEFDKAIACYTKAIELDPNDHAFYSNRSAAYLSLKNAEKALEDANSCVRVSKSWAKGYSLQGAAYHYMKRYENAIAAYEAGLNVAPTDASLKSGLEEVSALRDAQSPGGGMGIFDEACIFQKLATHPKFAKWLPNPIFQAQLKLLKTDLISIIMQNKMMMEVLEIMLGDRSRSEGSPAPSAQSRSNSGGSNTPSSSGTAKAGSRLRNQGVNRTDDVHVRSSFLLFILPTWKACEF